MDAAEAIANASRTESKGHLLDLGAFEYFQVGEEVYRAPLVNPMGTDGLRQGVRWECPIWLWECRLSILRGGK